MFTKCSKERDSRISEKNRILPQTFLKSYDFKRRDEISDTKVVINITPQVITSATTLRIYQYYRLAVAKEMNLF